MLAKPTSQSSKMLTLYGENFSKAEPLSVFYWIRAITFCRGAVFGSTWMPSAGEPTYKTAAYYPRQG
jgi:hypothetical protein